MGNIGVLSAGEFQLMSAGTGVTHSEYNPSSSETLEFLQIWIKPNQLGIEPGYQQKKFPYKAGLQLIASPDAREKSLLLYQDAFLYQLIVQAGQDVFHTLNSERTLYLHVVSGQIEINGEILREGDGATVKKMEMITFNGNSSGQALIFDLP